jgi:hypothetical protein
MVGKTWDSLVIQEGVRQTSSGPNIQCIWVCFQVLVTNIIYLLGGYKVEMKWLMRSAWLSVYHLINTTLTQPTAIYLLPYTLSIKGYVRH